MVARPNESNSTLHTLRGIPSADLFRDAVSKIKIYRKAGTSVNWVNWRQNQFQIKVSWNNNGSLSCYLNFFSAADRDHVHAELFERYAKPGTTPYRQEGHGWTKLRHDFGTDDVITINELAQVADEAFIRYTVIYAQEDISVRPLFDLMGIPLVPGEMGKELIDGVMTPYSREVGKCL